MRGKDKIVVWPTYFDSTKTRSEGRRVPKGMAVHSPEIMELREAVRRLDLDYEEYLDACYPKTPWLENGMLLVSKREHKNQTIKEIAKSLLEIRKASRRK